MNVFNTSFAYRLVTSLIGPFLPLLIRKRIKDGKENPKRVKERYGRSDLVRPPGELIWLHGASVGETQMLRPLIDRLLEKPDRHILVTSGTRTSAELLVEQLPERAIHQYLPLDTPRATARFVAHWFPNLAIFAESELWPNLIWTTERAGIPLALINARMSDASIAEWRKRMSLGLSVLSAFDRILAADRRTANGIAELAQQAVPDIGSLKFDAAALSFNMGERDRLRKQIGERPVWLAASTHEAEEAVFHRFHDRVSDAFMIWLPRHPARGPDIAEALGAPRRSASQDPSSANAYVMDTMGEMGLALALADVCVLGGSFDSSLMGHNPLEAARAGVPVISGPYHASFVDLYRSMIDTKSVLIADENETVRLIHDGLSGKLDEVTANATQFAANNTGSLDRTVMELEQLL